MDRSRVPSNAPSKAPNTPKTTAMRECRATATMNRIPENRLSWKITWPKPRATAAVPKWTGPAAIGAASASPVGTGNTHNNTQVTSTKGNVNTGIFRAMKNR
jgi:hypothetical protein